MTKPDMGLIELFTHHTMHYFGDTFHHSELLMDFQTLYSPESRNFNEGYTNNLFEIIALSDNVRSYIIDEIVNNEKKFTKLLNHNIKFYVYHDKIYFYPEDRDAIMMVLLSV